MRCEECDYPLWNLTARQCPECGKPFRPGEYEFVRNSVQFCCPHCDQGYYGTGPRGHLSPSEFDCVNCHKRIAMDGMVLRPTSGVSEVQTRVERMPWLERAAFGRIRAWFAMIGLGMVGPHRLAKSMPADDRPGQAWLYAFVTWALILAAGAVVPLGVISVIQLIQGDPDDALRIGIVSMSFLVGSVLVTAAVIAVWGLVTHAMLRITGGCNGPLSRTFTALCYASGPGVIMAAPCIGPYCFSWIAAVWWIVSAVLLVTMLQRVHGGRAAAAVLILPGTVTVIAVLAYFGWIFYFMTAGFPGAAAGVVPPGGINTAETLIMTNQLRNNAEANGNQWVDHGARLVVDDNFGIENYILRESETLTSSIAVGDTTLSLFITLTPNRQSLAVDAAANALPEDVVAHRVGDFVFTYHGVDQVAGDPGLWIVVMTPDPDEGPHESLPNSVLVGCVDGTIKTYDGLELAAALEEQNTLRSAAGLGPLPDPTAITHDMPAR
jgi:hypothetical protein